MQPLIKKRQWWLIIGLIAFFLVGLGAGIGTFNSNYFADSVFGIVDWLAASILYFFLGAVLGLAIDFWISKPRSSFKIPVWFYTIVGFLILSLIAIFISLPSKSLGDVLFNIAFPFYYAVFFHGFTYFLFFPSLIIGKILPKLILDIIYLGIFLVWLEYQSRNKSKKVSNVLLALIFTILSIGMISCAIRLGMS